MRIKEYMGRRWLQCVGMVGIAAGGYVAGLTTDRVTAQQPVAAQLPTADKRVVAYIYGNVPVTREELGDFLINRGGHEKLELLVNRKIIDYEAAKRNITITAQEVEATLATDVLGLGISVDDFIKHVLPRYNKTIYEWKEDVIKPRLLLGKMCQSRVKINEDDIKKQFENKYGERRQPKIICWGKDDEKIAIRQWDEARKGDAEFDEIARHQATPNLASGCGLIAPLGRFPDVEDETCTKELYKLKQVGDITGLIQTPAGIMCMKLNAIISPEPPYCKLTDQSLAAMKSANVPDAVLAKLGTLKDKDFSRADLAGQLLKVLTPDEVKQNQQLIVFHSGDLAVSYAKERPNFERVVYEKKMALEIQKYFGELKALAQPNLLLRGAPTSSEIREAAQQNIQDLQKTGGTQPGNTVPKNP